MIGLITYLREDVTGAYSELDLRGGDAEDIGFNSYLRKKRVEGLETLINDCPTPPFKRGPGSVYEWHAFDLVGDGLTDNTSILLLDVHT